MRLTDLPWLPPAPEGFRQACRTPGSGTDIRRLAGYALDINQLTALSKAIDRIEAAGGDLAPLGPMRIGLLGNGTTSLLAPALRASAARHGLLLDVVEAPYDQAMQTALDPASAFNRAEPDAVLLAFDHRLLSPPANMADAAASERTVEDALSTLFAIRDAVAAATGATVVVQTLAHPPAALLGGYDRRLPGTPHALADSFNARLVERLEGTGTVLLDVASMAASVGLEEWHDAKLWHLAKMPFAQSAVPLYADHAARLLGALAGRSRKCLVLDLDNTLWGGVIGDDGLGGISIGQGDPVGEAHLEVQRTALMLRSLGVILAVSSKNDEANARLPFREHPDMLLREDDIAVFQANWTDKASNLEAIARALDIGVDALVLLDDNPAERAQVRAALPQVAAPELPADPALFARTLLWAGYFETVALSGEDLIRADDYTARARRIELKATTRDLGSYLASLDMEITLAPFDATGRTRIAQLINKSNQFNLTTRRYTETDIAAMEKDPSLFTLQVRLRDRFGDNGMISVAICRTAGATWEIDTWLMSCRVLGRGVEQAVLSEIVRQAAAGGAETLKGRFIPSGRNEMVRGHYAGLGFVPGEADGEWLLSLAGYTAPELPMRVVPAAEGHAA